MQFLPPASSVSSNSRLWEANRPSSSQRHDVTRTRKSLSTFAADARSAPVPRTHAGSLPTFSGVLPTPPAEGRSAPAQRAREVARQDVTTKKVKVDIDLTEDNDDFEKDLDAEMMMIAQTTEEEISIHSSSSSSRTADNWRQPQANTKRNLLLSDTSSMNASHETLAVDDRRHVSETSSHTASDPDVSRCTASRNSTGSMRTSDADKRGVSNGNEMDMKCCVTDPDIKDVKHCSFVRNSSADSCSSFNSISVPVATYSTSPGSIEILLTILKF